MYDATKQIHINGFSLIETMACLALMSLFAIQATQLFTHSFQRIMASIEIQASAQNFLQAVHLARSEAMRLQTYVSMRPICDNRWDSGWEVFMNPTLDFRPTPLASDILLDYRLSSKITSLKPHGQAVPQGNQFEDLHMSDIPRSCDNGKNHSTTSSRRVLIKHISFNPAGGAHMKSGGFIANRLILWHKNYPEIERQILMSASGRIRICNPDQVQRQCSY